MATHNLRRKQAFEGICPKPGKKFKHFEVFQLNVGGFDNNFSYLVVADNLEAAVVDPSGNARIISEAIAAIPTIFVRYILLTHGHRDHYSALQGLKEDFPDARVVAHPQCMVKHDIDAADYQKLEFGDEYIECIFTPGHTEDSMCFHLSDDSGLLTGDTLFIGCCGYCEPQSMFHSLHEKILPLAESNVIYSGHDYGQKKHATLGEEKSSNPYLMARNIVEFTDALKKL